MFLDNADAAPQVKTLVQVGSLDSGWLTLAFATLTALLAVCMIKQLQFLNEVSAIDMAIRHTSLGVCKEQVGGLWLEPTLIPAACVDDHRDFGCLTCS